MHCRCVKDGKKCVNCWPAGNNPVRCHNLDESDEGNSGSSAPAVGLSQEPLQSSPSVFDSLKTLFRR